MAVAPSHYTKNMDEESNTCVLIITKLDQPEPYTRREAYARISTLLRSIVEKDDMRWQGEMKTIAPMGMSVTGSRYKAVLVDVPEEMIAQSIIPGLEVHGCTVKRMQKDLQALDKKRSNQRLEQIRSRVDHIGDVADIKATIDRLSALRGDGGSADKKRRFAQGAMTVLSTSMVVGSAHLEEAKPQD